MRSNKILRKILHIIIILTVFMADLQYTNVVYAANLSYYNYNTKSNVNYSGKQVTYTFNNKEIALTYPGIILSGTALADYEELFVQELGLKASLEDNDIILTDGITELILTLGSKKVKVNGETEKINVAPVKLKFEDESIRYYVPTRFVAETFGFNYIWNSDTCVAKITETLLLSINKKTILYSDTFYTLNYNGFSVALDDTPIICYNGCILAPARKVFEAAGCSYTENASSFSITKDNISIDAELNSSYATIKDHSFELAAPSLMIVNQKNSEKQIYVSLESIANLLGFKLTYEDNKYCINLQNTEYTGNPELHPELKMFFIPEKTMEEQEPLEIYFEWTSEEIPLTSDLKKLNKVIAYALEDADVIELYGITRNDINDFMDNRALIFELPSVIFSNDTKFFVDFEIPHLKYALMTTVNKNTKLFLMIPLEDEWHFVEQEECVQVYFMHADLSMEDLFVASEQTDSIVSNTPEVRYPENQFVICLPEEIDQEQIIVQDNYFDRNIQIQIPGDCTEFFVKNEIHNPYEFIKNIDIVYNAQANRTSITLETEFICGYETSYRKDYFALRLGKPSEIYNKIVVLDAGHGGKDPGAVRGTVLEKDLNYSILYTSAKGLFENSDIKVYYTRTTDTFITLQDRVKFVKEVEADIFISLHMNASVYDTAAGTEVFYSKSNNKNLENGLNSNKLAQTLANNLCTAMDSRLRGVTKSDYYVIQYNSVPAVLIELGFISNKEECSKLSNKLYQEKAANAIYQSVIEIFSAYPTGR